MLYITRIKNLTEAYPRLSRVWFKSDDPRTPLKSIWVDEARVRGMTDELGGATILEESADLAEDHLVLLAAG